MAFRAIDKPSRQYLTEVMKDKTNKEAAVFFGCSLRTIVKWLNDYNLNYHDLKHPNYKLNDHQSEFLTACMLGDGTIKKEGRFRLKMKKAVKEYVLYARDVLSPFSREIKEKIVPKLYRSGNKIKKVLTDTEYCESCHFYTITHPILKEWRQMWYRNNIKIIPSLKLTPYIVAHWIIQDGTNSQSKKTISIATNSFTDEEVYYLIELLKKDLSIQANLQRSSNKKQPMINIGARQYYPCMEVINPHVTFDCFQYKIDTSKCPKTKPGYGACKLNYSKANEIRRLYDEGWTQQKIADKYDVTQGAIGAVVNNKTYSVDVRVKGSAEYR